MPTANRAAFLKLMRDDEQQLRDDFKAYSDKIRGLLTRRAGHSDKIPPGNATQVAQEVANGLLFYFLAGDGLAFTLAHNGHLSPKSPFARLLWGGVNTATSLAVHAQAAAMKQRLPMSLQMKLAAAPVDPFTAYDLLTPEAGQIFKDYVPQGAFIRGDNRNLEDRILNAASETRRKINLLMVELLTEDNPVKEVADTLDQFLTGKLDRHNKPYGTTALFDASRLLASEVAFASARAGQLSALRNPFVESVDIVLSTSHREADDCDGFAAGSPYTVDAVPLPPFHSKCLCEAVFHMTADTNAVIERLRGNPDLLKVKGPLSPHWADMILRGGE